MCFCEFLQKFCGLGHTFLPDVWVNLSININIDTYSLQLKKNLEIKLLFDNCVNLSTNNCCLIFGVCVFANDMKFELSGCPSRGGVVTWSEIVIVEFLEQTKQMTADQWTGLPARVSRLDVLKSYFGYLRNNTEKVFTSGE